MTVSNQANTAIFDGAVVLTRGLLVVHSDHMVVSFHPNRNGADSKNANGTTKPKNNSSANKPEPQGQDAAPAVSERSIRMVEATGRVRIEKEDGRATCQKAVYYEDEKKIILTGDPVAWQKGTRVSGKRIIMFLDEDRSVVEGDSQVVIEGESGGEDRRQDASAATVARCAGRRSRRSSRAQWSRKNDHFRHDGGTVSAG